MTRSRALIVIAVVAILVWVWRACGADGVERDAEGVDASAEAVAAAERASGRSGSSGSSGSRRNRRVDADTVIITGTVIDRSSSEPVGNVEVVFRNAASGEETAMAAADGTYRIEVPPGTYRAFVRDDTVLSVGVAGLERLPTEPTADTANAPDEAVMPLVVAIRDTTDVDLAVLRGGVVTGRVLDRAGRPIKGAAVRASSVERIKPALGTDVAETDADGNYELRLPSGDYRLEAAHPRYAGAAEVVGVNLDAGDRVEREITLAAGCVIAGRVVGADGALAGEGAIERQHDGGQFVVQGKIFADGTFRWTTTDETEVTLRAWPWKSPSSPPHTFECKDGARYYGIVFQLPRKTPDLEGLLVDASGAAVPLAYLDIEGLDDGTSNQQERSDAAGRWGVFDLPPGRYRITAYAQGRGVTSSIVEAPQTNVRLALAGTGRIEGTTILASGTIELQLVECTDDAGNQMPLPVERRLVTVTANHFELDGVPACQLTVAASWQGRSQSTAVAVEPGGVGKLELTLGPLVAKHVTGTVRDSAGRPVDSAYVVAWLEDSHVDGYTNEAGRYELDTYAGASIAARAAAGEGHATVGRDDDDRERIDITLQPAETPPEDRHEDVE